MAGLLFQRLLLLQTPLFFGAACFADETMSDDTPSTPISTSTGDETSTSFDDSSGTDDAAGTETGQGDSCEFASDGTECGVAELCLGGDCVASLCGDGFVDETHGEQCEDGNTIGGDGCEANCVWTCTNNAGCDDGNVCNGSEICQPDHTCSNPPDASCGDENSCTEDVCDPVTACAHSLIDGDGDGYAWAGLGACGPGTVGGDCNDMDPAIHPGAYDGCDGQGIDQDCDGQVDEDGDGLWYEDCDADGYAALGAQVQESCGTPANPPDGCDAGGWTQANPMMGTADCDDSVAGVHPGAFETAGNGRDDNCDGQELCFRDQDNDGYRTDETASTDDLACNGNGHAKVGASLEWKTPGAKNLCCDQDSKMHSGQTDWFALSDDPDGNAACPGGRRWDYDCDGTEKKRWTAAVAQCFWEPNGCSYGGDNDTSGWATNGISPSCGTPPFPWNYNCHQNGLTSCSFDLQVREQECH